MDKTYTKQDFERQQFIDRWKMQRLLKHKNTQWKTIHITERKRHGSSKYFSANGVNVSAHNVNLLLRLQYKNHIYFQFDAVFSLFSGFGKVQSIQSGCKDCQFHCCSIEFESARSGALFLKKSTIKFDGSTFEVRPKDEPYQSTSDSGINTQLQRAPADDSPKNILNLLNDHCLCEIFKRIDHVADIHAISNVCTRFNAIAQTIFPAKINSRWINFDDLVFDDGTPFNHITLERFENFLSTYGPSIQSLKFRPHYFVPLPNIANLTLRLIHTYCKNIRNLDIEIVKELQLNEISNEMYSMLSKLKSLHIRFSDPASHAIVGDFLAACTVIEELSVYGDSSYNFLVAQMTFSNLIKFKACSVLYGQFFQENLQLQEIEIDGYVAHIRFICQNMVNLIKLTLSADRSHFVDLRDLDLLRQSATINLDGITTNRSINQILHLQNITEISLYDSISSLMQFPANLIVLAENLRNLERIKIQSEKTIPIDIMKQTVQHASKLSEFRKNGGKSNPFSVNDYNVILSVVQAREQKIKLTMTLESDSFIHVNANQICKKLDVLYEHPALVVFKYFYERKSIR